MLLHGDVGAAFQSLSVCLSIRPSNMHASKHTQHTSPPLLNPPIPSFLPSHPFPLPPHPLPLPPLPPPPPSSPHQRFFFPLPEGKTMAGPGSATLAKLFESCNHWSRGRGQGCVLFLGLVTLCGKTEPNILYVGCLYSPA